MLNAIQGVYRSGKIELSETPQDVREDTPVIVTFLSPASIELAAAGIDEMHAAELRARLATFAEDWESQEMEIYDDYDAAKQRLEAR